MANICHLDLLAADLHLRAALQQSLIRAFHTSRLGTNYCVFACSCCLPLHPATAAASQACARRATKHAHAAKASSAAFVQNAEGMTPVAQTSEPAAERTPASALAMSAAAALPGLSGPQPRQRACSGPHPCGARNACSALELASSGIIHCPAGCLDHLPEHEPASEVAGRQLGAYCEAGVHHIHVMHAHQSNRKLPAAFFATKLGTCFAWQEPLVQPAR